MLRTRDPAQLEREIERLQRAVDELSLLNDVATAAGAALDLDDMIRTIVKRSIQAVSAEQGAILLVDERQESGALQTLVRLDMQSTQTNAFRPDDNLVGWMQKNKLPLIINDPASDTRFRSVRWDPSVRSILCVPLLIHARLVGLLAVYNKSKGSGFTEEDKRLLAILAAQSAQAVARARQATEQERVLRLFGQHTAPAVVEAVLRQGGDLPSTRIHATVMFLDIRGFTTYAEHADPGEVVAYLNELFSFMVDDIVKRGGMVHQFLGDGFLALFGVPIPNENDASNAVGAAIEIVQKIEQRMAEGSIQPTRIGIGIHSGEVVAGTVGTQVKLQYSVTGDVVNLASRIESLNKSYDSTVLISEAVASQLVSPPPGMEDLGPVDVRGRSQPVRLFKLG